MRTFILAAAIASLAGSAFSGAHAGLKTQGTAPPADEARAVAYLVREVPRWKQENDCYSCHNNGDAARALIVASRRGHDVGTAIDDTLAWLREPQRWNHNKTTGGIDDKPLARIQFAGALRLAVDAGLAPEAALADAAGVVAADQHRDGSWRLDTSQSLGSPTTYGTALATWAATRTLHDAARDDLAPAVARARSWLRTASVETLVDAAAVVLALGRDSDRDAQTQRQRALDTVKRGQSSSGGWGPYTTVGPEAFDTALVTLALIDLAGQPSLASPAYTAAEWRRAITRGRDYLRQQQLADGSWPETTRPPNQESYAQRISTTGWALLALMESRRVLSAP
jgi:squalene cyclase